MGWAIAFGILILIAILPVGVSAFYDAEGPRASIILGPVRIPVFPVKKKEKKESKEKPKKKSDGTTAKKKTEKSKKKGGSITDFLPLLDAALDLVAGFGRRLRVHRLQMKLILGGTDPADLAVNYGRGWAVLGNLIPLLERAFVIQKQDLEVECDFLSESTTIVARLDLSITIGRIITLLFVGGIPVVRQFLKIMKMRKGGTKV